MASIHRKAKGDRDGKLCYMAMLRSPLTKKQSGIQIFVHDDDEAQRFVSLLNGLIKSVKNREQPARDVQAWLDAIDDRTYQRLVDCHLAEPTDDGMEEFSRKAMTCEQLADWMIDKVERRKRITESTKRAHVRSWDYFATILKKQSIDRLNLDLGNQLMDQLCAGAGTVRGDRKRQRKPKREDRSPSYIDTIFKHFDFGFKLAVREGLLPRNPFESVERPGQRKGARRIIEPSEALAILKALAPGDQQVIWGLARFAGLRIPSELIDLRWGDVVLEGDDPRILIRSPKTKRYDGKESRTCPLLFGLREILTRNRPKDATDDDYVIATEAYRRAGSSANNRWLQVAIEAAELERWPSLWRSARVSAERDMRAIEGVDPEQVNLWIGHESKVARKHYREPDAAVRRRAAKVAA